MQWMIINFFIDKIIAALNLISGACSLLTTFSIVQVKKVENNIKQLMK